MAVDSDGNTYGYDTDTPPGTDEPLSLFCETAQRGATTWLRVELNQTRELDDWFIPDWVDIPMGCGGDVLRVDLSKGVIS